MKKLVLLGIAACLLLGGCASKIHYTKAKEGVVVLYLKMPEAQQVALMATSNNFRPIKAQLEKKGIWSVAVPAQEPMDYFYLVDGEPYTPPCMLSRPDGFGGTTCIFDPEP